MATAKSKTNKKTAAKKATAEKAPAKKSTAKKATAKKAPAKKSTAKKAPAKKSTAKKTAAKKATAKKATAKKATAKKTTGKKTTGKKTTAKKTTGKKTTKKATAKKMTAQKKAQSTKKQKALLVVESPAKARTIGKYLGSDYLVRASVGHVKDLPKSKIGVDVDNNFEPQYEVIGDKKKVIDELQKIAKRVEQIYLAPDPDREGEAIAWHIAEELRPINPNIRRVLINEITKKGVSAALEHPTTVNNDKTNAQQARRILDRLVGYQISPILWKKVRRGLSAGRVQSVAVRILVEREYEISKFIPEEYWSVECDCEGPKPPPFLAKVNRWNEEKADPKDEATATEIAEELRVKDASITKISKRARRRRPQPPFITSKLQQDAARKLRFSAKRTMALAQRLYEGVEIGDDLTGLITYMRTDSTRVSDDALKAVREQIGKTFGTEYLPEKPVEYKSGKRAQDAHEAIRPTVIEYDPDVVAKALESHSEGKDLVKLYTLIWQRFVASQMKPAVYDQTTVDITAGRAGLRATGQIMKFPGYTKVYEVQETDDAKKEESDRKDKTLPPIEEGDPIKFKEIRPEQHFTQPPPRFSEASLVKELEDLGIGRPSTYASILSTIVDRGYVDKKDARFFPTELGILVNELLVDSFPDILNADFTAKMEANLDDVEDGDRDWRDLLGGFYDPFKKRLESAKENMRDVKREEIPTDHVCEKCGKGMVIKWGRNGSFLACSGYPECRNTKEIERKLDGTFEIVPMETTDEKCEKCEAPMVVKRGRYGSFLACSRYPDCKTTKPIPIGVDCPKEDCNGYLTQKRSKRGRYFYGCSNYAKTGCDAVFWDQPIPEPCPVCEHPFLLKKENKSGITIKCSNCDYKGQGEQDAA